jgi:DNA ligase (NAD+)
MELNELDKMSVEQLVHEIKKNNKLYWENNAPAISDEEYDLLLQQLEKQEPNNPVLDHVGVVNVASIGKVVLDQPMISLEKTYFFKDAPKGKKSLLTWAGENARSSEEIYLIQPKYDGISANYSNNILATRGQGTEDENVTDKVPLIELETLGYKGPLERPVRGEIIIRNDDFKTIYSKVVKNDGKPYKNSRNAVGGIMGLKDISLIQHQGAKLTIIDYDMISYSVKFKDLEQKWSSILERIEALPYPMDGIVIKLDDREYGRSLGLTAHHPRDQIAFKFSGMRKKSVLLDVEWSFGKNNLTPVGKIEPIELSGVTISSVTLHNISNVEINDWQIGDTVVVERAGDVIPHIVDSVPGENRKSFIIDKCPSCNSKLERENKELRCTNPHCVETNLQRILAAVKNIGIEELGEPNIRKMMTNLKVESLKDIFDLSITDILKLDGFKEKSASNLYKNIKSAREATDYQLIAALNIEGIGQTVAEKILKDYSLQELRQMTKLQLSIIPEIGSELSEKLYRSLIDESATIDDLLSALNIKNTKLNDIPNKLVCFDLVSSKLNQPLRFYETLLKQHHFNRVKVIKVDDAVYLPENIQALITTKDLKSKSRILLKASEIGAEILSPDEWVASLPDISADAEIIDIEKTVCFTGKMPEKRSFYESIAKSNGLKSADTVTKNLSLLIVADVNSTSSKVKKARNLGVEILALEDWLSLNNKEEKPDINEDDTLLPGFL